MILYGDHGENMYDRGRLTFGYGGMHHGGDSLYEEAIRVPVMIFGSGIEARRISRRASLAELGLLLHEPRLALGLLQEGRVDFGLDAVLSRAAFNGGAVAFYQEQDKLIWWKRYGLYELYDLSLDPGETNNLATADPERLQKRKIALEEFLSR